MAKLTYYSAFDKRLKKKVNKTKEARQGAGIYKRRNRRDYRAIMHLSSYKNIVQKDKRILNQYGEGFVVLVKPDEYFEVNGDKKNSFPSELKLGVNSFIYFRLIQDWKKYGKFCGTFREVVELFTTRPDENFTKPLWIGEYAKEINNTNPKQVSLICQKDSKTKKQEVKKLKEKLKTEGFEFDNQNFPAQAGLGNYDFDYASKDEMNNVCYQMSYLILQVPGIKDLLVKEDNNLTLDIINKTEKHIKKYCEEKNLLDYNKLSNIGAWNVNKNYPICPLCKKKLDAEKFFEQAAQAAGREMDDNTQSEIVLMHVDALRAGEFNHRTFNLGWGHKHCNTIQADMSIEETISTLKDIIANYEKNS